MLRLESDAELVKVVTVHKSKGLEYPLVFLPFAVTARKTDRRNRSFFEYVDEDGARRDRPGAVATRPWRRWTAARLDEDLRLLYVALTRARHFLWLGVAAVAAGQKGENRLHESALGYLLAAARRSAPAALRAHCGAPARRARRIELHDAAPPDGCTMLAPRRRACRRWSTPPACFAGPLRAQLVGRLASPR